MDDSIGKPSNNYRGHESFDSFLRGTVYSILLLSTTLSPIASKQFELQSKRMADEVNVERENSVQEFCKITGVSSERGRLYLESSSWNLDLALSSFYEESEENEAEDTELSQAQVMKPPKSESRFATLSSIISQNKDEEEGQAFYAGGSERSGQQVLGPGKRKAGHDLVEEMFKAAKGHGAQVVELGEPSGKQSSSFHGTGYRLGSAVDDAQVIPGIPNHQDESVDMCLKLWNNGFSIDEGALRAYDDPVNKEFLESIKRGEIPRELISQAHGSEVNLNMEDHRHEEYVAPKRKIQAFSGSGHRLGSPTPQVEKQEANTNQHYEGDNKKNEEAAQKLLCVDESSTITNVQIRLADGSRLVVKLNHSHTVGDIRRYIVVARPQYSATVFSLLTSFPSKELCEDDLSVKEANLLNSTVIQKLK